MSWSRIEIKRDFLDICRAAVGKMGYWPSAVLSLGHHQRSQPSGVTVFDQHLVFAEIYSVTKKTHRPIWRSTAVQSQKTVSAYFTS